MSAQSAVAVAIGVENIANSPAERCSFERPDTMRVWTSQGQVRVLMMPVDDVMMTQSALQAREAYEKGLELEPDDHAMQEARHKANVNERKAMETHQHRFKKREPGGGAGTKHHLKQQQGQAQSKKPRVQPAAGVRDQARLSFADEEEES